MKELLIAEEGLLKGQTIDLSASQEGLIGRDAESCDVVLNDPKVSRNHVRFSHTSEGVVIENLSETNPLTINDVVIASHVLKENDKVKIGSTWFHFTTSQEALSSLENPSPHVDNGPEHTIFKEHIDEGDLFDFHILDNGRWVFKVITGPNSGAEFHMEDKHSYTIGNDPGKCDIILNDLSVSRQHARISIENEKLKIEDLKSKNGTYINSQKVEGAPVALPCNQTITVGTTSFIIIDKELASETIISHPLMPQPTPQPVVEKKEEKKPSEPIPVEVAKELTREEIIQGQRSQILSLFKDTPLKYVVPICFVIVLLVLFGIASLFKSSAIPMETAAEYNGEIESVVTKYPTVEFNYTPGSKTIFLLGHVLTDQDHAQLLYNLQQLPFIGNIQGHIIIDEGVWKEMNLILGKVEHWRSINVHSPIPGRFVITGYLKTRQEFEDLNNYINLNFNFLDRIENRVVVEENIIDKSSSLLFEGGFVDVILQVNNGEITLTGFISSMNHDLFGSSLKTIEEIQGVRSVKNYVIELTNSKESVINLTNQYQVTGSSLHDQAAVNVIINGRILRKGDNLDGMFISGIEPNAVYLEKDGVRYKIEYKN